MSREEWEHPEEVLDGYVDLDTGIIDIRLGGPGGARDEERERRALAALALHGQPYGFTWDDVDQLRGAATAIEGEWGRGWIGDPPDWDRLTEPTA